MRKFAFMSALASLGLLAVLVLVTDPARMIETLKTVPAGHVAAAFLAVQVQILASAYRWRFTAGRLGHEIAAGLAIQEYYVSSALNLILPGGMSGDAIRAYRNRTECEGGWKRPAAAVLLERLSGQIAFFFLCAMGVFAWPIFLKVHFAEQTNIAIWALIILILAVGTCVLAAKYTRFSEQLRKLGPSLASVFWRDGAWFVQAGLNIIVVTGYIATFMIASDAVGASLPPIAAFTIIPLCLLTMLIPAGIGGWGTREAAAAVLWPVLGFDSTQGLAASLLYGGLSLAGASIPGMIAVFIAISKGRIGRAKKFR
nr:lysylphosphatidylglycerol synthase transmembrane domain-containing protein [uncultured Cohaesibacter sp.]